MFPTKWGKVPAAEVRGPEVRGQLPRSRRSRWCSPRSGERFLPPRNEAGGKGPTPTEPQDAHPSGVRAQSKRFGRARRSTAHASGLNRGLRWKAIVARTSSVSWRTSEFQNLMIVNPARSMARSRRWSRPCRSWWSPSHSTARRCSRQAKSRMYGSRGCCRRNRHPSWRRWRWVHRMASAFGIDWRSSRARRVA